ncbi:MAG: hypothetical protein E7046_11865 [Lentisphaerae bacterium]|nr:hypothetical protein [Lentisphaerota bacterium]
MRNLTVWRIDKLAKKVGDRVLSSTLAQFSIPLNKEVEDFIRNKALQATKLKSSITYVLVDEDIAEVIGYFTLLVKPFTIPASCLSSTNRRLISRFSEVNEETGNYTASVFLLAQIGKNYAIQRQYQVSGRDLLEVALDKLRAVQDLIGGKLVLIERETERMKLHDFYKANGFKSWNSRYDKNDNVQYDQMIRVIESIA